MTDMVKTVYKMPALILADLLQADLVILTIYLNHSLADLEVLDLAECMILMHRKEGMI